MDTQKKFAVLIDADNVSPERFERIFGELSLWGQATYRRIYGNWAEYNRSALKEKLVEYALTPVQQFNYIKGKNATDIAMVIDAMDILYTGTVDGFAIVTNDSDFTRLALRLRESGMTVIGMGDDVAPASFRAACTDFVVLRESRRIAEELTAQKKLRLAARRSSAVRGRIARGERSVEEEEKTPAQDAGAERAYSVNREAAAETPAQAERVVLSDRDLRQSIKNFLFECREEDGWMSASVLVNKLKTEFPDLDIKDYADLPLFAGKRKIWTTYFLSLGFCENIQKGPSNYALRLKADERRKISESRENGAAKAETAADAEPVNAADTAVNTETATAAAAAPSEDKAKKSAGGRRRGGRRKAEKPAEATSDATADNAAGAARETTASANDAPVAEKPARKAETEPAGADPAGKAAGQSETKSEPKAGAKTGTGSGRKSGQKAVKKADAEPSAEKPENAGPEKPAQANRKTSGRSPRRKASGEETAAKETAAKEDGSAASVKAEREQTGTENAGKKPAQRRAGRQKTGEQKKD